MPEIQTQTIKFYNKKNGIYDSDRHSMNAKIKRRIAMRNKYSVKCAEYYVRFLFK